MIRARVERFVLLTLVTCLLSGAQALVGLRVWLPAYAAAYLCMAVVFYRM